MRLSHWTAACALGALVVGTPGVHAAQREAGPRGVVVVHDRFDDHDRDVVRRWYDDHHDHLPVGLRERDRLSRDLELKLDVGFVLDRDWRRRMYAPPADLIRLLPVPPRGDRYEIIGGHVVLIGPRYEVIDVIHLGHDR